ncbi:MAG: nickel-dependent hydrogenase large subunit [Armatimonadetes bacterium]|nr:nickel-dependent hydrogenase large subunit [Armatimonadota bacterium]
MSQSVTLNVPLNRVEGDLEVRAELEDGVVTDAWCAGTLFRGLENVMLGRSPMDSLVITPRICGLCSTAHLSAAARALDQLAGVEVPPDATRVRNIALITEHLQSDLRHTFLMFAADFANPIHADLPLHEEAVRRYAPLQGDTVREVIRETKRLVEVLVLLGGQWPHSAYMVPGGVASALKAADLMSCRLIVERFQKWYERRILGCTVDRWLAVRRLSDLEAWLDEREEHRDSDLGFFIRFSRAAALDSIGRGPGSYLSFGGLDLPEGTRVRGPRRESRLVPAGYAEGVQVRAFDPTKVTEDVTCAWYHDYGAGRHPMEGETKPYATGDEGGKYSWIKAPRYDGRPAETGPLAEMIIADNPLFADLVSRQGASAFVRQLARLVRPAELLGPLTAWLHEARDGGEYYRSPENGIPDGEACGLVQATRGALGHWLRVSGGRIAHYQVVTPTAWHTSPRDAKGVRGPVETALLGVPVRDPENPVELGYVVRSYDQCLVCSVHTLRLGRPLGRAPIGVG